jgi:glycolate oxidase iron-sulfur subunit
MKEYGHLLRDDPGYAQRAEAFSAKVRDVSELLHEIGPVAERHPVPARVAYHDACHLGHAQQVTAQPRAVLRGIPEMTVVDIPETEICCGSAGIYNLVQPVPAEELGRRKVAQIGTTDPDAVVTGNAGCLLQIRRYLDAGVPLFHPVQLVDASIRGVDPIGASGPTGPSRTIGSDRTLGTSSGGTGASPAAGTAGATTGRCPRTSTPVASTPPGPAPIAADPFGDEGTRPDGSTH